MSDAADAGTPDPLRILLIEDDEEDRIIVEAALRRAFGGRFTLVWRSRYAEALEALAERAHDVVLVDYRLGPETGLDVLRAARSLPIDGPFIMLTGEAAREVDLEAMREGAADYLTKTGLDPTTLERSIRYAIQHERAEKRRVQLILEQEARARAEDENRLKDQFLAIVSHELRTPLNAIIGWASMLRTMPMEEAQRARALASIERNAASQRKLVEDLLDVSRMNAGTFHIQQQPMDLSAVVRAAIDSLRPDADARQIQVDDSGVPANVMIDGDAQRLQQVVVNVAGNAIKYTPEGGRIEVRLSSDGRMAHLAVVDNGQGIDPQFLPQVFERFRQASGSARAGGLGLGLAIAREIVVQHGGSIAAASAGPGRGTTITIALPTLTASG